ncbi:hypothetical protein Btru_002462 [Bulinus truncatus]|nr:hypothetical protein Btru_002462 [Bulinus truncatus]
MNVQNIVLLFFTLCVYVNCDQQNVSSFGSSQQPNISSDISGVNSSNGDFDAMGKPSSGVVMGNTVMMGSYDLCVSIGVDGDPGTKGSFLRLTFKAEVPLYLPWQTQGSQETGLPLIYWFICLPSGCSQDDAMNIGTDFANKSGLQLVDTVMLRTKDPTGDKAFITAVVILSVLGAFCLIGTVIDVCVRGHQRDQVDQREGAVLNVKQNSEPSKDGIVVTGMRVINDHESDQVSSPTFDTQQFPVRISTMSNNGLKYNVNDTNSDSNGSTNSRKDEDQSNQITKTPKKKSKLLDFLLKFFLAFSVPANLADILKAKHAPGDIKCLHGIRVLTISWVFLGHCYFLAPQFGKTFVLSFLT